MMVPNTTATIMPANAFSFMVMKTGSGIGAGGGGDGRAPPSEVRWRREGGGGEGGRGCCFGGGGGPPLGPPTGPSIPRPIPRATVPRHISNSSTGDANDATRESRAYDDRHERTRDEGHVSGLSDEHEGQGGSPSSGGRRKNGIAPHSTGAAAQRPLASPDGARRRRFTLSPLRPPPL